MLTAAKESFKCWAWPVTFQSQTGNQVVVTSLADVARVDDEFVRRQALAYSKGVDEMVDRCRILWEAALICFQIDDVLAASAIVETIAGYQCDAWPSRIWREGYPDGWVRLSRSLEKTATALRARRERRREERERRSRALESWLRDAD
jgi:hypothetical protein